MGIHGLLPFLKPFTRKVTIEEFKGKKLGVDAMCWMHKGAFACSHELVQGIDTDKFVHFFLKMCEVLRASDIKPVIVFDGARLPAKAKEEAHRYETREQNRAEALQLFERRARGEQVDENLLASKCQGAIRISTEMISRLMTALRELSIQFCVAPFEADAQLAYLCRTGWVDAVISEDSDLLAYGCPSTIFKMDKYGNGDFIALPCLQVDACPTQALSDGELEQPSEAEAPAEPGADNIGEGDEGDENGQKKAGRGGRGRGRKGRARGRGAKSAKKGESAADTAVDGETAADNDGSNAVKKKTKNVVSLSSWTAEKFTEFCVLCGTDYKEFDVKIKMFGIKTAFGMLRRFRSSERMFKWMLDNDRWRERFPCSLDEFLERFFKVVSVFFHHVAFDPRLGRCVSIANSFPKCDRVIPGVDVVELCGTGPAKEHARSIFKGIVDARTLGPRPQEPLTPAERRTLDYIMSRKRQDQQQYNFQQQLRAEAAAIQAERATQGISQSGNAAQPAAGQQPQSAQQRSDSKALEFLEDDEEDEAPKQMFLKTSDHKAVFAFLDEVNAEREQDKENSQAEQSAPAPFNPFARRTGYSSRSVSSSNPFARKRELPQPQVNIPDAPNTESADAQQRPNKLRCLGSRQATPPQQATQTPTPPRPAIRSLATPQKTVEQREIVDPVLGPRGGQAASDAALTVLAQRGTPKLKPLEASQDKGKLNFFFKQTSQKIEKAAPPPKPRALDSWKARPWEEDEPQPEVAPPTENPLSLAGNRSKTFRWGARTSVE